MKASSEMIAGDRVGDRQREEAEPDGQHDGVQHGSAPSSELFSVQQMALGQAPTLASVRGQASVQARLGVTDRIGIREGKEGCSYRNLIKNNPPDWAIAPPELRTTPLSTVSISYEIPMLKTLRPSRFYMPFCPSCWLRLCD